MKKTAAVILAAGKGVRMRSAKPKALCEISGKPMIEFLIDNAKACGINDIVVIGGYKIGLLEEELRPHRVKIIEQKRLLGSADALKQAASYFRGFDGTIMVLYADTPLLKALTLRNMLKRHRASKPAVTLLTTKVGDAKEYGRILRDEKGGIRGIVEKADIDKGLYGGCCEVNVGAYCFAGKELFKGLRSIKMNKKKKEFYLTDIVSYFYRLGYRINSYKTTDAHEALGVNRQEELMIVEDILRERTISRLIRAGVRIKDPANTYIQEGAKIGRDTAIYPFVVIERDVVIGRGCRVGPFAHLRRGTILRDNAAVGNFVEVVRSKIGRSSRVKHHTYLGDTSVGKRVNIGAGTITANYDGKRKNKTFIDDDAFIGSGTTIVAPVRIGRAAITGAGSVVVKGKNVEAGSVVVGVPARPLRKRGRA